MQQFKDEKNRKWDVTISGLELKKVKSRLDINLMSVLEDDFALLKEISTDIVLMGSILWVCCEAQADKEGIDEDEFFTGLLGDSIVDAQTALFEAIADFFPRPQQRALLHKILKKSNQVSEKALGILSADAMTAMDKLDIEELANSVINSSTNSLESAE